MRARAESWSTQQLTDFLALVSSLPDAHAALRAAVRRVSEVLEAEVVAVVRGGSVSAATGPWSDAPPEEELTALAGDPETAQLTGLGSCRVEVAPLETEEHGRLLVARAGSEEFSSQERDLLGAMARVLVVTLRMFHRQELLQRLSTLQRMIVRRDEPRNVLHAVVAATAELIGDEVVCLRLRDPQDRDTAVLVASAGLDPARWVALERSPAQEGIGGRALSEDRLVVADAEMAAPVHEEGEVVGSIVVAARHESRRYGPDDQEALLAFAEHASLALTDARTVHKALHQAFHDPLTDLPNRALFIDRLELGLSRVQRSKSQIAVLFLDVDRFKIVNDSLGHAAGDELLREVAARLVASIRPGDTAARFGGDEFAILLEDVDGTGGAEQVALRILCALRAPLSVAGRVVFISASIGIAMDTSSAGDMIRDADLAMYRAKAEGKDRHAVFEPAMHVAVVERADLEADLQRVIERDELVLHYQPIVALGNRAIIGVEALVRWRHPTRGLVEPEAFIPLAEETQLMCELGRWILTEASRQVALWRMLRPLRLSVNLSAVQLQSCDELTTDVGAALKRSGLPPEALVLEITEAALMRDVTETITCLQALKGLGVLLAVDDFGSGYSSLDHLRRFPIDMLKIDKAFVDDLGAGDSTLAQAIIDLGESFDLQVVAEGVEHEFQRQRLLELGCTYGQGYHFAAPMTAHELHALIDPVPLPVSMPR
ncbi:MAG: hypothetical protein QOE11_3212 [Solirubrobacteraceae bacterium]|jgi:diguanylate cyclase (GGDEF)-like protein|nr:hypothetical protein [Solirubrobacteraceae bacterium]